MQGLITPTQYRCADHLKKEYDTVFRHCWNFVGLKLELANGKHLGVLVAGTEVIIQLDKNGNPRAYRNVCSHRHAKLCEHGSHDGPVRCPYHSWLYNEDGVPVGIPQPQAFPDVVANPEAYKLEEFSCESAGQFIFVRLSKEGSSLKVYLNGEYDFLCKASQGMSHIHHEFRSDVDANWKVVIENSLEGYHVPAVHNKTFMKVDGMQRGYDAPVDHLEHPLHSSITHPAEPGWLASFEKRTAPKLGVWDWYFPHYTHHLIFPNLTITSFLGYSYHIQRFEPTAAGLTTVHSRAVGMRFEQQSPLGEKTIVQIYADSKAFTDSVFAEDGTVCKTVQQGLNSAVNPAVIGLGIESRVAHFHQAYTSMIAATSEMKE
ncbi:MAG: (2Fe-2S)-binding protein [Methylotenera sp.]|uniref:aromatic ring-hydroxylating oxygenase subunit alpha n=1 Tax=Methylotenera sp. TaxID=2051956 RepID=UPI000D497E55|nr:aromatic ring-hydroxylating dioxygenase subunit alpha [Methylotenera sp.]PPC81864.1 MAG: (2Fe-2S)-binding protein [Methylotenera sp.]